MISGSVLLENYEPVFFYIAFKQNNNFLHQKFVYTSEIRFYLTLKNN